MAAEANPAHRLAPAAGQQGIDQLTATSTRRPQRPFASAAPAVRIIALAQLPPGDLWRVTLDGGDTVTVETNQLQRFGRFAAAARQQVGRHFAPMRTNDWLDLVDDAMAPLREARRKAGAP